jgi:hypothetical protein
MINKITDSSICKHANSYEIFFGMKWTEAYRWHQLSFKLRAIALSWHSKQATTYVLPIDGIGRMEVVLVKLVPRCAHRWGWPWPSSLRNHHLVHPLTCVDDVFVENLIDLMGSIYMQHDTMVIYVSLPTTYVEANGRKGWYFVPQTRPHKWPNKS